MSVGVGAFHHVVVFVIPQGGLYAATEPHLLHHAAELIPAVVGIEVLLSLVIDKDGFVAVVTDALVAHLCLYAAGHAR